MIPGVRKALHSCQCCQRTDARVLIRMSGSAPFVIAFCPLCDTAPGRHAADRLYPPPEAKK